MSLRKEVVALLQISDTKEMLEKALAGGSALVLLKPPPELIEKLLLEKPPPEAVKVVVLFHVLYANEFDRARNMCMTCDDIEALSLETVSGYALRLIGPRHAHNGTLPSNMLNLADIGSTPEKLDLVEGGRPLLVYRINRVLAPIPVKNKESGMVGIDPSMKVGDDFESIGANLNYAGPDLKLENDKFVNNKEAFGNFAFEAIRQMLLAAARVAFGSTVIGGKVVSTASEYDLNMFTFQSDRAGKCAINVQQYHMRGFVDDISKFADSIRKCWAYLKGKKAAKKIELAIGQTGNTVDGYKRALIDAGFGKTKLIGKPTEVVTELQPIAELLGNYVNEKGKRVFADFFVGFVYMLDNDWKTASNWFDNAVENGHNWIGDWMKPQ